MDIECRCAAGRSFVSTIWSMNPRPVRFSRSEGTGRASAGDRSSGLRSWLDPGRVKILQHMFVPRREWHWYRYECSRQLPTCSLSRLDLGAQYLGEACDFCAFCFNNRQEFRRRARAHGQPVTRQTGGDRWIGADRTDIRADVIDEVRTCIAWCVETEESVHRDVGIAGLGDRRNVRDERRTLPIRRARTLILPA